MIDVSNVIRNVGSDGGDLYVQLSIIDADGNAQSSSQGFQTNILRLSDSKWWNSGTLAFDLGTEPSLLTGSQVGNTGVYEYYMLGGFDGSSMDYIVHLKGITTITFDFYASCRLMPDTFTLRDGAGLALDEPNTLLAAPVSSDTGSLRKMIQTMMNLIKNKKTETSSLQTIRNEADSADFATKSISDAAGTLTVGKAT